MLMQTKSFPNVRGAELALETEGFLGSEGPYQMEIAGQ